MAYNQDNTMINKNILLLEKLETLLKQHDWTYQYSDDHRWYKAGQQEATRIREVMQECNNNDLGTMAKVLYDKYNALNK